MLPDIVPGVDVLLVMIVVVSTVTLLPVLTVGETGMTGPMVVFVMVVELSLPVP